MVYDHTDIADDDLWRDKTSRQSQLPGHNITITNAIFVARRIQEAEMWWQTVKL